MAFKNQMVFMIRRLLLIAGVINTGSADALAVAICACSHTANPSGGALVGSLAGGRIGVDSVESAATAVAGLIIFLF